FGAVPAMKASSNVFSQEGFARSRLSASMRTNSTPDGFEKYILSGSDGYNCVALIMNSVQMGNADRAPSRLRSRLSSYPTQAMARRSFVYPANHPSREVPVLPAAGNVKPRPRTPMPVPELITPCIRYVMR